MAQKRLGGHVPNYVLSLGRHIVACLTASLLPIEASFLVSHVHAVFLGAILVVFCQKALAKSKKTPSMALPSSAAMVTFSKNSSRLVAQECPLVKLC